MDSRDFSIRALYDALDEQRRARGLTWTAVTEQVNRGPRGPRSIAPSTLTRLKDGRVAEGDGVLQMLRWLGRSPESFLPDHPDANAARFQLPTVPDGKVLRWDTKALFSALDARRKELGLTWTALATEIGGFTPAMLTHLARGPRIGFPGVMRIVRWLGQPAAVFMRQADS